MFVAKTSKIQEKPQKLSRLGRIVVFISVWDSQTSFPSLWEALDGKILQSGWCSHHSEILKRISGFQNSIEKPIWNCCILRRYHEIWHSLRTQQQKKTQYKLQKKKQAFHSSLRCHCKRKIFEVRIVAPQTGRCCRLTWIFTHQGRMCKATNPHLSYDFIKLLLSLFLEKP